MISSNFIAFLALAAWPFVACWLFARRSAAQATLWTLMGAQLLLPPHVAIKFEGIPALDKVSIPNVVALIGCAIALNGRFRIWKGLGIAGILIATYVLGPFITAELNGDSILIGSRFLPAESHYDALSAIVAQLIMLIPFILGRRLFREETDSKAILTTIATAGLAYSFPMLFEVRMSPQLNNWIYGYYSSDFIQAIRDGGFRPMVFMGHPLAAAFFMMTAAVASVALWQARRPVWRITPALASPYLWFVLAACRSLASFIYGVILTLLIRITSQKTQMRAAVVIASLAFCYPMLRYADLVPTQSLLEAARTVSADRERSLGVRFENENRLMARAKQRLWFGWGRWGRSRVYDTGSGKDISVTDGLWLIALGQFGLFGFIAQFGLLILPIFRMAFSFRLVRLVEERIYLSALCLILAVNVLDMMPNSGLTPWTWLIAGAILGRAEALKVAVEARQRRPRTVLPSSPAPSLDTIGRDETRAFH